MHRLSHGATSRPHSYRCRLCKSITASYVDRSKHYWREKEILTLLRAGHTDKQIVKKVGCHHRTVARLRLEVGEVRRCECGQHYYHARKCRKRAGWQAVARERREAFDELLIRINRRVPTALPEEMRADICQEMLLEVLQSIEDVLGKVPIFIREYKRNYPFQYQSLDANPNLLQSITG